MEGICPRRLRTQSSESALEAQAPKGEEDRKNTFYTNVISAKKPQRTHHGAEGAQWRAKAASLKGRLRRKGGGRTQFEKSKIDADITPKGNPSRMEYEATVIKLVKIAAKPSATSSSAVPPGEEGPRARWA